MEKVARVLKLELSTNYTLEQVILHTSSHGKSQLEAMLTVIQTGVPIFWSERLACAVTELSVHY